MKKRVALMLGVILLPIPLPVRSDTRGVWDSLSATSSGMYERFKEKISKLSFENLLALGISKIIPNLKYGPGCDKVLRQLRNRITTSKEAISLTIDTILSNTVHCLYPYVHEHFYLIRDHLVFGHGRWAANSWDAVESILQYHMLEFFPFIPPWARRIEQNAPGWQVPFYKRLFVRRVIEWEVEEFYELIYYEFASMLTQTEKELMRELLFYSDSESDSATW